MGARYSLQIATLGLLLCSGRSNELVPSTTPPPYDASTPARGTPAFASRSDDGGVRAISNQTYVYVLEEELIATDSLIRSLTARLSLLQRLREDVASGRVNTSDVERILGSPAQENESMTSAGVEANSSKRFDTAPADYEQPSTARRAADDWVVGRGFGKYLIAKRSMESPPSKPSGEESTLAAPRLIALLYHRLNPAGGPPGGGRPTGQRAAHAPARRGDKSGGSHGLRLPSHVAIRVYVDGTVQMDSDAAGALVCVYTPDGRLCAAPTGSAGLSLRGAPWWGAGCRALGAALGELPEPSLLVSDSCGHVHVLSLVVRHGGRVLAGRRRAQQPDALLHQRGAAASGAANDDASEGGHKLGTDVQLYPQCTILLPHVRRAHSQRGTRQPDATEAATVDPSGGVVVEDDTPQEPIVSLALQRDVATAILAYSTGASIDRGNVILVGTGLGGALLAFHRNCSPVKQLFAPQHDTDGPADEVTAPAPPISALTRQGTIVAFASGSALHFASLQRFDSLAVSCDLPLSEAGAPVHAASLSYDPAAPSLLWAGGSDGSVMLFNTRTLGAGGPSKHSDSTACRMLARLPPLPSPAALVRTAIGTEPAHKGCLLASSAAAVSVGAVRGYVIAASGAGIAVYNVSDAHKGHVELAFARPSGASFAHAVEDCLVELDGDQSDTVPRSLPLQLLEVSNAEPPPQGGRQKSRSGGSVGGAQDITLLLADAQPSSDLSERPSLPAAPEFLSGRATFYDVLLPQRRSGSGLDFSGWEVGGLGLIAGLLGMARGPVMLLFIAGVVYYNVNEVRRKARDGDNCDDTWGAGDGAGGFTGDGRLRGGRRHRADEHGTLKKGLKILAQGASFFLLRGPLGMAARIAISRYNATRKEAGKGFDDDDDDVDEVMGADGDFGGGGGRGAADRYERAVQRMTAQARMNRELQSLDGRAGGDRGSLRQRHNGARTSRAEAEISANREHIDRLLQQQRYERAFRGDLDDGGGMNEIPGGGRVDPYAYTDSDDDAEGLSDDGALDVDAKQQQHIRRLLEQDSDDDEMLANGFGHPGFDGDVNDDEAYTTGDSDSEDYHAPQQDDRELHADARRYREFLPDADAYDHDGEFEAAAGDALLETAERWAHLTGTAPASARALAEVHERADPDIHD